MTYFRISDVKSSNSSHFQDPLLARVSRFANYHHLRFWYKFGTKNKTPLPDDIHHN